MRMVEEGSTKHLFFSGITKVNLLTTNTHYYVSVPLFIFRLTIAEEGCEIVLKHSDVENILMNLIMSLGIDEAGGSHSFLSAYCISKRNF